MKMVSDIVSIHSALEKMMSESFETVLPDKSGKIILFLIMRSLQ